VFLLLAAVGTAQAVELSGTVRDETGGALPGVSVELRTTAGSPQTTATDAQGRYRFDVAPGRYHVEFALLNFATARRDIDLAAAGLRADVVLHLALSADVTVTGSTSQTLSGRQAAPVAA
jgi:protocatechuate 3,4-dioxygenase beta subunit